MERVIELLFSDSSKNFSDLKSRQWTATNLSVVAIMALAALTHGDQGALKQGIHGTISPIKATVFMFFDCGRSCDSFCKVQCQSRCVSETARKFGESPFF